MVNIDIQTKNKKYISDYIHLTLTNNCNLYCKHCFANAHSNKKFISFSIIKKILYNIKKNNILYIDISGGEPTTHPDFIKIIKYLDNIRLPFYITSNGIFSKKICNAINNSKYIMGVKISLDGITYKSYNFIRNHSDNSKKLFELCLYNIKKLSSSLDITINTIVHIKNCDELNNYPKILNTLNVHKWIIAPLLYKGRGKLNKTNIEVNIKKINFKKIKYNCNRYNINVDLSDFDRYLIKTNFVFECGAGISFMNIDLEKKIAVPCVLLKYTKYNQFWCNFDYKLFDVNKIWNSVQFDKWRTQQVIGCKDCKLRDKCWRCPIQNDVLDINYLDSVGLCFKS